MVLPFAYSMSDKGDYVDARSAYATVRDILDVCLNESTEKDIAELASLPPLILQRYLDILLGQGLLASSAGRWFKTTERGMVYLAHYQIIRRLIGDS